MNSAKDKIPESKEFTKCSQSKGGCDCKFKCKFDGSPESFVNLLNAKAQSAISNKK